MSSPQRNVSVVCISDPSPGAYPRAPFGLLYKRSQSSQKKEKAMRRIDENTITDAVSEQMARTEDPRFKQIMTSLIKHLHAFAREVELTPQEWLKGIGFLTDVGHKCTAYRQEFVAIQDKKKGGKGTQSSLLGPFYRRDSPKMELGQSIATKTKAPQVCIYGRITDAAGKPIPGASIEIWQTDDDGDYDLQKHDPSIMDLRGHFHSDSEGRYHFRSVIPRGYSIPLDGPVGTMIHAQGRDGRRPAHIHFLVGAPGYYEVATALYMTGDSHLEADTVFGVSDTLVVGVRAKDSSSPIPDLPGIHYDFQLVSATEQEALAGRVGADPSEISQKKEGHTSYH
jgi:protocatechuate 3,4-dioxygenase beta subunit